LPVYGNPVTIQLSPVGALAGFFDLLRDRDVVVIGTSVTATTGSEHPRRYDSGDRTVVI